MGCWNGTCGITHLPIYNGEKVRLILIGKDPEPHSNPDEGYVSPSGMYYPLTVPILATYDDYGGAIPDDPKDPITKICVDRIKNFKMPKKEADLLNLFRDKKLSVDILGKKISPGIFMIREGVYQSLLNAYYSDIEWDRHYSRPDLRAAAREKATDIANLSAEAHANKDADGNFDSATFRRLVMVFDRHNEESPNELVKHWGYANINFRIGLGPIDEAIRDRIWSDKKVCTEEAVLPLLLALADALSLNMMMEHLRRGYMPQAGAGSQSGDNALHRYLTQTTLNEIEVLDRPYDDEEEE